MSSLPELARANFELSRLARMGESLSGRERNCCYLNTGGAGKRFANVSAITGFDYPDDARAVAMVDWDRDGDLDAWLSNRTSPRIRLLRNQGKSNNHFLAIKLEGRTCNRDAIGATVEVVPAAESGSEEVEPDTTRRLVKTLRAGEGFASQSSKWIHFGLGKVEQVEKVIVRWPDGPEEIFRDVKCDHWFHLVQGTGIATEWTPPQPAFPAAPPVLKPAEAANAIRTVVAHPAPLPRLPYQTLQGETATLGGPKPTPTVVTFWTSDCRACQAELRHIGQEEDRIRQHGLDIIAINADKDVIASDAVPAKSVTAIRDRLRELRFPFKAGTASTPLLDKLYIALDQLYARDVIPAVPLTLLLDQSGVIKVVYQGRVELEQLISDLDLLSLSGVDLRNAASGRPGRWLLPQYREDSHIASIADALGTQGYDVASSDYLRNNQQTAQADPRYMQALVSVGIGQLERGELSEAEATLRQALEIAPENIHALSGLGRALTYQEKYQEAIEIHRAALKIRPRDVRTLVTLGMSLQFDNQAEEAVAIYRKAIELQPDHALANLYLAKHLRYNGKTSEAIPYLRQAAASSPNSSEAHYELGLAILDEGQLEEAREHLEKVAGDKNVNQFVARMNNRSWLLASRAEAPADDHQKAIVLGKIICDLTNHEQPALLDTLAVAYAATLQFDKAIELEEKAMKLANQRVETRGLLDGIEARLELFRNEKPYVEKPQSP